MKKLISFDWDWTLWYPASTKYWKKTHWIYEKYKDVEEANKELVLIPWIEKILNLCKENDIHIIVLSTNPNKKTIADMQLQKRTKLLWVNSYFNNIISARDYYESKWIILEKYYKKNWFKSKEVLHIWDSFQRDYLSVWEKGIDSLLINTPLLDKKIMTNKIIKCLPEELYKTIIKYIKK